jgi:hypothetical protein
VGVAGRGVRTTSLTPSSLASDPRVFLNEAAPGNGEDDPQNKTALIFAPFWDVPFYSYVNDAGQPAYNYSSSSVFAYYANLPEVKKELEGDGYHFEQLLDGGATVQALIAELTHGASGSQAQPPGVVVLATHGGPDGFVATASSLGLGSATDTTIWDRFKSFENQLDREGYRSLVTTKDALEPVLAEMDAANVGGSPLSSSGGYVAIGPGFWRWLEDSAHVSFEHSLVLMNACYTDQNAALREAVHARAYFAWNKPVNTDVTGAVLQYLVASLSRYTHSAEEAYYNLVRVAKTGQEIYAEDHLLNGVDYWVIPTDLDAYGSDGTIIVPYVGNGWQDPKDNAGEIWWLLYAARWSHDSQIGAENIESCYSRLWSHGELGGLGNQFCQNANTGTAPTESEVSYAVYLLTGRLGGAFNGTVVPRFTIRDGA